MAKDSSYVAGGRAYKQLGLTPGRGQIAKSTVSDRHEVDQRHFVETQQVPNVPAAAAPKIVSEVP